MAFSVNGWVRVKRIFIGDDGCFVGTICKQGLIQEITPEPFKAVASNRESGDLSNEVKDCQGKDVRGRFAALRSISVTAKLGSNNKSL